MNIIIRLSLVIVGLLAGWTIIWGVVTVVALGGHCALFRGGVNVTGGYLFLRSISFKDFVDIVFGVSSSVLFWGMKGVIGAIIPVIASILAGFISIILGARGRFTSALIARGILLLLLTILFFFTSLRITNYGCGGVTFSELFAISVLNIGVMTIIALCVRPQRAPRFKLRSFLDG